MCKVSIIVPVYNTEQYLPRCLDSILSQSFTDFELLLVDDGSKDNSGAICDAYAEKDSRVRVFHKEKGGVSSARNLGLDEAKGEWICFADSDDWLNEKYLEHLMDSDSNLVVSGLQSFGNASWSLCPQKRSIFPVNDICSHWNDELKGYFDYPVAKRFKSSIVHTKGIRFNKDLFYSEDLCFVLSYMVNIDSVDEIDVVDYQYFTPPPPPPPPVVLVLGTTNSECRQKA
ncbi:MAG: glycosyltransferase family 2 protein [Bacteroidales bacterium]|nr:glycosyltransferase family 2 protein [Bacteroidales bacterium]